MYVLVVVSVVFVWLSICEGVRAWKIDSVSECACACVCMSMILRVYVGEWASEYVCESNWAF